MSDTTVEAEKSLSEVLKDAMKEHGLNQVQLGKKSGLTQQVISQYLRSKAKPGYDALISLQYALEIPWSSMFETVEGSAVIDRVSEVGTA